MKPVTLPPGRARLSTKPAPTGSAATGNTIGTVRVACSNGRTVEVPWARMTSGASAANSAACLRISLGIGRGPADVDPHVAADAPAQLLQLLQERPDAGLKFWIVRGAGSSTPMRRIRSPCCARAASGHAAAAPPRSVMNSRRCMCPRKDHALCRAQSVALCDQAASEKWYTTARRFLRRRNVRFGSKADILQCTRPCPLSANSGHFAPNQIFADAAESTL